MKYLDLDFFPIIFRIPEIGEEGAESSSLLNNKGLPAFDNFAVEKCIASISKHSNDFENEVRSFDSPGFEVKNIFTDIINPLEHLQSPLELTWALAKVLYLGNSSLMPTKSYMHIHNRALQARCSKFLSVPIYKAVVKTKKEETNLTEEETRLLSKYELEGRLNGLQLSEENKDKLGYVIRRLSEEESQYREKNRLGLLQFNHTIHDPDLVQSFPENLLKIMAADPNEPRKGPWKVTHQPGVYEKFLEYCPDKKLRWNVWMLYVQLCSPYGEKSINTGMNLLNIREMRNEKAKILGYETFADMSMETKMLKSRDNVNKMITSLLERARPIQDIEVEKLEDFAKERGFDVALDYCDILYWARKQKKALYNIDDEEIRDYFPLPVVLQGLFDLCSKLFDIKIIERPKTNAWHGDVKFYEIFDSDSPTPIAGFYLDPYTREEDKIKITHNPGWMLTLRNRSNIAGTTPLAALIFNFHAPMYGKPSLLSFQEVLTLFHKFGHSLRHLLTEVNYFDVAGMSNVEWDTADVTGHVLTHWLYEPSVIQGISSHYTTKEPLPTEIAQNLDMMRKHMAGYKLCHELYLSKLDMEFYSGDAYWRDVVLKLWPEYHTLPYNKYDCHPLHFTKIFCEESSAAYFCDTWSRVLAADIYSAFHEVKHDENSILEVGLRFKDTYLAAGGSCDPNELFRRFRGRDPSYKALLHTLGLKKSMVPKSDN